MFRKKGLFVSSICHIIILALVFSSFPLCINDSHAEDDGLVYLGEAVATGETFLSTQSGQRLKIDASPYPVLDKTTLQTTDGGAVISLIPGGTVEVLKDSEVLVSNNGDVAVIDIKSGTIRFDIPADSSISITTPAATIDVRSNVKVASTATTLPAVASRRAGAVRVVPGIGTVVTGEIETLEVITNNGGKVEVVGPGETIMLALAQTVPGGELIDGFTRSQLSALSRQPGIKVLPGVQQVPKLGKGEVALAIPPGIGGGYIVGTPDDIAAALNRIGFSRVTAVDVLNAAEEEGRRRLGWWPIIAGGAAAGGLAALIGGGGGGGGGPASPSTP